MGLFCSLFLIFIGIVGIHLQFIAVSILGIGTLNIIDAVISYGLKIPFLFCLFMTLIGCICSVYNLLKKTK